MGSMRLTGGICVLALLAVTPCAADPALAVSDVNMRRGPGLDAPVILLIPGGSNVEVLGCGAGWCEVVFGGRAGFANQRFFDFGGDPPPPPRRMAPPPQSYPPPYPRPPYPPPGYGRPPGYGPPPGTIIEDDEAPVYRGPGYYPPPPYGPSYRPG